MPNDFGESDASVGGGQAALQSGDYTSAYKLFAAAAERGLALGQHGLGLLYEKGQGVPVDYAEAIKWYRKAAEQGMPVSQTALGLMYYHGHGTAVDYAEAVKWIRLGAEHGSENGVFFLGIMYRYGRGVPRDDAEASKWFERAAQLGFPGAMEMAEETRKSAAVSPAPTERVDLPNDFGESDATVLGGDAARDSGDYASALMLYGKAAEKGLAAGQFKLGMMYQNGNGVAVDEAEAMKWYRKAAEQGAPPAQVALGVMYYHGQGVPVDYAQARKWIRRGAEQGSAGGAFALGVMYADSNAGPPDYAEALKWFERATQQGFPGAEEMANETRGMVLLLDRTQKAGVDLGAAAQGPTPTARRRDDAQPQGARASAKPSATRPRAPARAVPAKPPRRPIHERIVTAVIFLFGVLATFTMILVAITNAEHRVESIVLAPLFALVTIVAFLMI